jgi:hypothetical protein
VDGDNKESKLVSSAEEDGDAESSEGNRRAAANRAKKQAKTEALTPV